MVNIKVLEELVERRTVTIITKVYVNVVIK